MEAVTSQDLWQLVNLGGLQIKADRIVFISSQADANHDRNQYRWTVNTIANQQIKPLHSFAAFPHLCIKDQATALLIENNQILALDLANGELTTLADLPGQAKLQLADLLDDQHLLLTGQLDLSENEPDSDYVVLDELPTHFNGEGTVNKLRTHLFSYDLSTKELTDLAFDQYLHVHDFALSQDHHQLLFAGDVYHTKRPVQPSLYQLNLKSGTTTQIYGPNHVDVSTSLFFNQAFFLNNQPFLFGMEGQTLGYNTNPQFYRLNGHAPELVAAWDHSLGCWVGSDQAMVPGNVSQVVDGKYYFCSTITDHAELFVFDGQTIKPFFKFAGTIAAFQIKTPADFYLIGAEPNQTQHLYHVKDGQLLDLYAPNADLLSEKYVAPVKQIDFVATGQSHQHGWLLYPKDFDPQKFYPGLLEIHGGPKTAFGPVFFHEMQVLASQGYFVFFCNPHGSDGQGHAYADIAGHWGENDYADLMKFTDAVLAQTPQLDHARLGVLGGSYGGYMTNWIIGHTHRFQAACSQRSIANELSHAFVSDIGPDDNFFEDQASLRDNPLQMWNHSPLKFAYNVKTPTLFINSDEDYRCPIDEGLQMLHALLWYGVPARMCVFHGENHELSRSGKPAHRIRRLQEIINWFNQYLAA
ncbi:MAG: S9 family peptidase [Lactobacillus sp.]|jgi:acylaminoacyl-peptidase|nr:S9 family peptidase [Lactobacillus sp.]MCH3906438.1 S9 family peptidase [Lactobacillus sp.]MCI1883993.1 S9 family peptidase [Lactobacillus sp.]MCI1916328.1 S9 family peptidase [Lactobacillus sp.]MCI1942681.1 S9 family peptidase [Lactobacillus sp.]